MKEEMIVISRCDNKVTAWNLMNGESGIARCHPDDKFDSLIGAKLALDRLFGIKEQKEPEQPKYKHLTEFKNGKIYVFRSPLHLASLGLTFSMWGAECDGKIVSTSMKRNGKIDHFSIVPEWCEELPIAVGDRVKVVNKEYFYPCYSNWEGLNGFENHFVYNSALPEDGEFKVVAIKEHERIRDGILCLIQNVKTTQVFIMGIRGLEKIESEDEA